jgi:hypothetical protein
VRRLVIFALVFGLGGSVLWFLERQRQLESEERQAVRDVERPAESTIPPFVPPEGGPEGGPEDGAEQGADTGPEDDRTPLLEGERVVTSGAQRTNLPPRRAGEPRIVLVTSDMQPTDEKGTRYELTDVLVESFVVTGAPRAEEPRINSIEAAKGFLELVAEDLGLEFDEDLDVRLEGVVVRQFMNSPLAPLTLEAARLDAKLALEELRSVDDDLVTFSTRDIQGTGRGLVGLGLVGSLSFEGGADVTLELGEGRVARVRTRDDGQLNIVSSPESEVDATRRVRVRADGGVDLVLGDQGDDGASGESVSVRAGFVEVDLALAGEGQPARVLEARAGAGIEVRRGRDRFRGQQGRIEFEGARPVTVRITGEPRVTCVVDGDGEELRLELSGAGPVTCDLTPEGQPSEGSAAQRFLFVGPGELAAADRGGSITFENEARGSGRSDGSGATVLLSGGVRATSVEGQLASESVLATYDGGGVQLAAEGPSTVNARLGDGLYQAEARGGLTARLVDERWFIDEAREFDLEVLGEGAHRLSADAVEQVDVAAESLVATGGVAYQSLWGEVRSPRARVRGRSEVLLEGSPGDPVVLDLVPEGEDLLEAAEDAAGVRAGEVQARRITLTPGDFLAEGGVRAELQGVDGTWRLDSDSLRGERQAAEGGAPERSTFRFELGGVREATFDSPVESSRFSAERVWFDGVALGGPGVQRAIDRARPAELRATGDVSVLIRSLTANGPLEVLSSWELEAAAAHLRRGAETEEQRAPFFLEADEVTRGRFEGGGLTAELSAARLEADGLLGLSAPMTAVDREAALLGSSLTATGDVETTVRMAPGRPPILGRGDTFVLVDGRQGRLGAEPGKRVRATGTLPDGNGGYALTARSVDFTRSEMRAEQPVLEVDGQRPLVDLGGITVSRLSGALLEATREQASLLGSADAPVVGTGRNAEGQDVSIRAGRITLPLQEARGPSRTLGPYEPVPAPHGLGGPQEPDEVELVGFELDLGGGRVLRGDLGEFDGRWVRLQGSPATLQLPGAAVSAESIELDLTDYLLFAHRGRLEGVGADGGAPFAMSFVGIESQVVDDEILVTVNAPTIEAGADSARADFLALFLDRARWKARGDLAYRGTPEPDFADEPPGRTSGRSRPNFLAELLFDLQSEEYGRFLRSIYIEGGFEVVRDDARAAVGERVYVDLPRATAWAEEIELSYALKTDGKASPLRIRTDRLETNELGELVAREATMTTCSHEQPHFVVRTRRFALSPREDGRWRFSARGNRIRFQGGLGMPLPSIGNVVLDEDFGVEGFENEAGEVTPLSDIAVAQTARFGATLGAAFRFDVGGLGSWIGERLGMNPDLVEGKWDTSASYLWDRGPLLGLGLRLREHEPGDDPGEDFRVDSFVGGIPDSGRDRGTVRVPQDERDRLRLFGYVRARYPIVRGEWVDVAVSSQTDPGVQSEFYEREFQRFDQRDTFVRWRKALGADYLAAGVQKRINSFRSQKEELPSFLAYRGERSVGDLLGVPVLYGGSFEAGYFRRREGIAKQDLFSDLPGGAQLGIGDAEAGRADLVQRVSVPLQTGLGGVRATPFAEVRGTAWTEALDDDADDPVRGAAITGMELSTALHKVTDSGYLHALAPRISAATDVWYDQQGGELIPFDRTEEPIDGDRYEAGLRALWQRPGTFETLDLDVRATLRKDREGDAEEQRELGTLGRYITGYGGGDGQIGILHDGRYDLDDTQRTYTRSTLAIRPTDVFLMEFSYGQGRAIDRQELYETAGVAGRWLIDPKWEVEARYSLDLRDDRPLLTEFVLRRFGHDFVLDMLVQDRAGEGGTTVGLSFKPLLGWRRSRLGLLDRR